MSAYTDAIAGEQQPVTVGSNPVVIIKKEEVADNFWTAIKWTGAIVTLIVGYREAKQLYKTYLRRQNDEDDEADAEET
jgi:hypothetical protein